VDPVAIAAAVVTTDNGIAPEAAVAVEILHSNEQQAGTSQEAGGERRVEDVEMAEFSDRVSEAISSISAAARGSVNFSNLLTEHGHL